LAAQLLAQPTALCIVNTRAKARELFRLCKLSHAFAAHLSTSMCPDHRLRVLATIRQRLADRLPTLLISTQLIEAGVDVDFPAVYREVAPLDAIIQAAGRCNREGLLNPAPGSPGGIVHIFSLTDRSMPPDSNYKNAISQLRSRIESGSPPDLSDPAAVASFQKELMLAHNIAGDDRITRFRLTRDFPQVCDLYQLVEDNSVSFCIENYPFSQNVVADLTNRLPEPAARRRLSRFSVNVLCGEATAHTQHGLTRPHPSDPSVTLFTGPYDPDLGIIPGVTRGDVIV